MKALKDRFNGNSGEVVNYARRFGVFPAMRKYGVKDYIAMLKYLKGQAPGEDFQASQVDVDSFGGPDAFDKLLERMLAKFSRMEASNKAKDARIAELERQVEYYKGIQSPMTLPKVEAIFEYCAEE